MADVMEGERTHIPLNAGNVFAVTILAVIGIGVTEWVADWLSKTNIPVLSQLGIGAKYFLRTP